MPQPLAQPEIVGWETTLRCNMRCRHCGSIAGDARDSELSPEEALELCRQLGEMGVCRVVLTGGETLLRPDWQDIVQALLRYKIHAGLLTNGWVFTERVLAQLEALPKDLFHVAVSIDGNATDHDAIRGLDGSFARAFDGARWLCRQGVNVAVITTMNRANKHSLPELREQILGDLKPYSWQMQVTNTFGRAADDDVFAIDPLEYTELACFVSETRRLAAGTGVSIAAGDCLGYRSSIDPGLRDHPWTGCHAGLRLMGIRSNGDIMGCLSVVDDRYVEGSFRREPVADIWCRPGAFAYTREFDAAKLSGLCAGCPEGEACRGGCTAGAVSVNGQPGSAAFCLRAYEQQCEQDDTTSEDARPDAVEANAV